MIPRIYVEGLSNIFSTQSDGITYDYTQLKPGVQYTDKPVYYIVAGQLDNGRIIKGVSIKQGNTFIWTRGKLFAINSEYDLAAVEKRLASLEARTDQTEANITTIQNDIAEIKEELKKITSFAWTEL